MEEEKVYAERPNKTAIKKEMLELRDLGKQMIALREDWLDKLPISEQLKREVIKAKKFSKGALRRQLIFLEKLMREEDAQQIKKALEACYQPHKESTEQFHQVEQWRDALLKDDNHLLEELLDRFVALDRQHIRQLIRNAAKESQLNKPPKSSRALFRYIKESTELSSSNP
ncbi:MAG: ribosome biogenesis factor YjgA [Thiotrichaceae bacterium]